MITRLQDLNTPSQSLPLVTTEELIPSSTLANDEVSIDRIADALPIGSMAGALEPEARLGVLPVTNAQPVPDLPPTDDSELSQAVVDKILQSLWTRMESLTVATAAIATDLPEPNPPPGTS